MVVRKQIKPYQSVFKLDSKYHSKDGGALLPPKPFVPRKAHRKSRAGCAECKKRRVKCDEARPLCGKCTKLEIKCTYVEPQTPSESSPSSANALESPREIVSSGMYSMAIDLVETDLGSLLCSDSSWYDTTAVHGSSAHILHHFQTSAAKTLGCSKTSHVMQSFVGNNAWDHPYLMHMILAISCAHQKRIGMTQHPLTEATHWGRGLQLLRQHLGELRPGSSKNNWDPDVAATFLGIMYSFTLDDDIAVDALSDSQKAFDYVLAPLASVGGFRSLYYLFPGPPDPYSRWLPILLSTDDAEGTFTDERPGIDGLPKAFADLCELDENSTCDSNPYHKILRSMTPLFQLQPSTKNFAVLFAFFGRCFDAFMPLLRRKDPRGMLLLSYWLGMLRQVDQWWLTKRARTACKAIIAHLLTLLDPKIYSLLAFPAAFESSSASQMWHLLGLVAEDVA